MKTLTMAGILLLLWVCTYYVWDFTQFRQLEPYPLVKEPLPCDFAAGECQLWYDFFESYSFVIKHPQAQYPFCSEACCIHLHLFYGRMLLSSQLNNNLCRRKQDSKL
ncbi:MAG TPA: hypothetical protein ENI48_06035 [Thioploca sp.]|nr:hypothetical protein [Thioploca sp.]